MIPRLYQSSAVVNLRTEFSRGVRRLLFSLPTGAGKTFVFGLIVKSAMSKKSRVGILVHRDSLLTQASDKLKELEVEHGIIAPGYGNYGHAVNVASVMTLVRRLDAHDFDLLIVDEAHHATAPTYRRIFEHYPNARVLGVTATPCRGNGKGLHDVYEKLIIGPGIGELIADGFLVEPLTYGPKRAVDLTKMTVRGGDYIREQLAALLDTPKITGDAVERYREACPGVPAVVFCVNIKHTEDVAAAFRAAGYRFESVYGAPMKLGTIRNRIAALGSGDLQGLVACDLISEGTDIPSAVCAINLRATKSILVHIQQPGRVLRPHYAPGYDLTTRSGRLASIAASDKPKAIILDQVGNTYATDSNGDFFNTVDAPREWTLEGIKKKKRSRKGPRALSLTQCPKCLRPHAIAAKCPYCGYVYEFSSEIPKTVEGELAPIDKLALRRLKFRQEYQCKSVEDLIALGESRGYQWPKQWAERRWGFMKKKDNSPSET
jgi:DNA repair protein RadD